MTELSDNFPESLKPLLPSMGVAIWTTTPWTIPANAGKKLSNTHFSDQDSGSCISARNFRCRNLDVFFSVCSGGSERPAHVCSGRDTAAHAIRGGVGDFQNG
jgi:hypothetical protein